MERRRGRKCRCASSCRTRAKRDASEGERYHVAIAIGVEEDEVAMKTGLGGRRRRRLPPLESPSLETEDRICWPTKQLGELRAKLTPWSRAAKDVRLMDQVKDLYGKISRRCCSSCYWWTRAEARARCGHQSRHHARKRWCIASNCNKQLMACYQNPRCRQSLDCETRAD